MSAGIIGNVARSWLIQRLSAPAGGGGANRRHQYRHRHQRSYHRWPIISISGAIMLAASSTSAGILYQQQHQQLAAWHVA